MKRATEQNLRLVWGFRIYAIFFAFFFLLKMPKLQNYGEGKPPLLKPCFPTPWHMPMAPDSSLWFIFKCLVHNHHVDASEEALRVLCGHTHPWCWVSTTREMGAGEVLLSILTSLYFKDLFFPPLFFPLPDFYSFSSFPLIPSYLSGFFPNILNFEFCFFSSI